MSQDALPYAEDLPYWQTGRSAPDNWVDKARRQIEQAGGEVLREAFGSEPTTGRAAFLLEFSVNGDRFRLVWPVLPTKSGREPAARIQAATMLYHAVKARCVEARVLGARTAFFAFLCLPDGRRASDLIDSEIADAIPAMFEESTKRLPRE